MNIDFNKVKGIIFDYGGTLDTGGVHWSEVIKKAYEEANVAVKEDEFREAYVNAERELARTRHILPEHDFHDMLLIKMQLELQWLASHGLFPSAQIESKAAQLARICYDSARKTIESTIPILKNLSDRYPLVLVSNFYGNIETVLTDFGIRQYFKKIIESSVVGIRKPDARIFELGIKALGITAEETLVIGDSYKKDILPAESLGCQVIWLKGKGWTKEDDEQVHPNIVLRLDEVLSFLSDGVLD